MLIVDGHNLAFADDDARKLLTGGKPDDARRRVMQLVEAYAEATGQRATVVFDGTGGRHRSQRKGARVGYRFSGVKRDADLEILRLVGATTGRREICVVTGDRRLGIAVRNLHAKTMGVKEFLNETARRRKRADRAPEPRAKRYGPPPGEVEYWLTVFSDDDVKDIKKERGPGRKKQKT